mmetsp:Transcript_20117/g.56863  ORF Transcript_20117/g.56863 Transcript_20117/m.56863 type:complete len:394 (-) Transcript_20117:79-1260(-)
MPTCVRLVLRSVSLRTVVARDTAGASKWPSGCWQSTARWPGAQLCGRRSHFLPIKSPTRGAIAEVVRALRLRPCAPRGAHDACRPIQKTELRGSARGSARRRDPILGKISPSRAGGVPSRPRDRPWRGAEVLGLLRVSLPRPVGRRAREGRLRVRGLTGRAAVGGRQLAGVARVLGAPRVRLRLARRRDLRLPLAGDRALALAGPPGGGVAALAARRCQEDVPQLHPPPVLEHQWRVVRIATTPGTVHVVEEIRPQALQARRYNAARLRARGRAPLPTGQGEECAQRRLGIDKVDMGEGDVPFTPAVHGKADEIECHRWDNGLDVGEQLVHRVAARHATQQERQDAAVWYCVGSTVPGAQLLERGTLELFCADARGAIGDLCAGAREAGQDKP